MSHAHDLLSILGGARPPTSRGGNTTSGNSETSILSFKAGKMTPTLQPSGKYLVEPDARRGELHLVWTATPASASGTTSGGGAGAAGGHLKLEWKDRRTKTVVTTVRILPEYDATFEKVPTGRDGDRVYLLTCGEGPDARHFFWMQDKDAAPDDDLCAKVNLHLGDPASAASAAGAASSDDDDAAGGDAAGPAAGLDNADLLRLMQGALGDQNALDVAAGGARTTAVPGSGSVPTAMPGQVDALGNILENLGVPHVGGTPAGERNADTAGNEAANDAAAAGGGAPGAGGLTLADLQGAMAGLATASPGATGGAAATGPPLSELASNDIVDASGILDDPDTVARLVALLPEGQRTEALLRDNIRSPQAAQCLQRLTAALADDAGSFNSIIANFQLDPSDGAAAMATGNPVGAFLECVLKDVERKEGIKDVEEEDEEEGMEETKEGAGGESKEDEGGDGKDGGGGDGDVKMEES